MRFGTPLFAIGISLLVLGLPATGLQAEEYGPFKTHKAKVGEVLVDAKGMTMYTFDKDKAGESTCTGTCAESWTPVKASAEDKAIGDFKVIERMDGSLQWSYAGKPFYLYKGDKMPGDVNGDGKDNVWHVVKPPLLPAGTVY